MRGYQVTKSLPSTGIDSTSSKPWLWNNPVLLNLRRSLVNMADILKKGDDGLGGQMLVNGLR